MSSEKLNDPVDLVNPVRKKGGWMDRLLDRINRIYRMRNAQCTESLELAAQAINTVLLEVLKKGKQ